MSEFEPIPEQPEGIRGRPVAWLLFITVLAIVTCGVVVWALDAFHLAGGGRSSVRHIELIPPALPFSEQGPSDTVRQEARDELEHWSWADKRAGLVRMPVSIAIDRYLMTRGVQ